MKPASKALWGGLAASLFALLVSACGGGGSTADTTASGSTSTGGGSTVSSSPASPTIALFAGTLVGAGDVDATGSSARFSSPTGVAVDTAGNVYVADYGNNVIRRVTAAGVVTTFAGSYGVSGAADGTGAGASFNGPIGVAVDAAGNVYVADFGNDEIRKITPAGVVTTLAGTGAAGAVDGMASAASFNGPYGVAVDANGNVIVADSGNQTIRRISSTGAVSTLAGTAGVVGSANGTGPAASFNRPVGVAVDSAGNVVVADALNSLIRKVSATGVVSTVAGLAGNFGNSDGSGGTAAFSGPSGVATDSAGNVYVADYGNNAVRMITAAGVVSTIAGTAGVSGSADGSAGSAGFDGVIAVASTASGNLVVADYGNDTIRTLSAGTVATLAGQAAMTGSADGTGAAAQFDAPTATATDSAGNVYVADRYNHTIRMITAAGVTSTLAGSAGTPGSDDGSGSGARFNEPTGVAVDASGNVYVADYGNDAIRKITAAGVVSTLAGNAGSVGSADGTGDAASFSAPIGVAVDSAGNVYVTDSGNQTVRKVTATGVVTTLAGTAGVVGAADGTGAAASFNAPVGIAVDASNNVFVTDYGNGTIRKITSAGTVSTLAGTPGVVGSANGTGAAASFNGPFGIAADTSGNLYVADFGNDTVRQITPAGVVSTLAGATGQAGFAAGALPGLLEAPLGVSVSGTSLYIAAGNGLAVVANLP